jgi:antitoxin component of MazEF toxin-antitoxin module
MVNNVQRCLLELLFVCQSMPIVSFRKIIRTGGSRTVALPPAWLNALDLKLGSVLLMVADGVILITPPGMKLQPKQLDPLIEVINRSATK